MKFTVQAGNGLTLTFDLGQIDEQTGLPFGARDWAGFFQALAQFMQVLIPLILPFINPTKARG